MSSPEKALTSVCVPRCLLPPPRGSPRSVGQSDPGPFQITASAVGPGEGEISCAPSESEVCISHSPLGLQKVSPIRLQSQTFWGLVFLVQEPTGETDVGSDPALLGGTAVTVAALPSVGRPPALLWFLLCLFSSGRSFLLLVLLILAAL